MALTAQLVTDLNLGPAGIFVHGPIVEMGGFAYFSGGYGVSDYELWKSDGTTAGTVLLKDINPGNTGSSPEDLTNINGTLYFSADDGTDGRELWKSNGTTAGTVMIKDIAAGSLTSHPQEFTNVNGTVFFTATDSTTGFELWKTNGTTAGTLEVKDIRPGFSSSDPHELVNFNGTLFFRAADSFADYQLWRSDGSSTGTAKVTSVTGAIFGLYPDHLTVVNGTLFFSGETSAAGTELWKSNGTTAGTSQVADIEPGLLGSTPQQLTNLNGILYFTPLLGDGELWRSDGTLSGTYRLVDIYSGFVKSSPTFLTSIGTTLFFAANDGTHGVEPWISNGLATGTQMLGDLAPGSASSSPGWFKFISGSVAFGADSALGLGQLWASPGSGSVGVVKDQIQAASQGIRYLTDIGLGRLLFAVDDGANGPELWLSTGSSSGTGKVVRDATSTDGSGIDELTQVGSSLVFSGFDAAHGHELWRSDGTGPATIVTDLAAGPGSTLPKSLTNLNGTLLYSAEDGATGNELWNMNVTTGVTTPVKDIFAGGAMSDSNPSYFTNVNGTVFFTANDGTNGTELWKTNGTPTGTTMVADIRGGAGSSSPKQLTSFNGMLVFVANDGTNGAELWSSDGTPTGTTLLKSIGSGFSSISSLMSVGTRLYFIVTDSSSGATLWQSNGSASQTSPMRTFGSSFPTPSNLVNVNGALFFVANDGSNGAELWKSLGSVSNTSMVKDIYPGFISSNPQQLTNVNGTLFFTAFDPTAGTELWKSDGSATGTVVVKDIATSGSSSPSDLTEVRGKLLFTANTSSSGRELWISDGTAGGTLQLFDTAPGAASSSPHNIFSFGRQLLFTADDGTHGRELWSASEVNAPPVGSDYQATFPEDAALILDFRGEFSDPGNVIPDDLLGVQILTVPAVGTFKDNGVTVVPNQFIPVADIAAYSLSYTPPPDAYGNALATITFNVKDDGGTANGGSDLSVATNTITFNFTSVNDPPSGADGAVTVLDHVPYKFSFDEFGFTDPRDPVKNKLSSVKITSLPTAGSLTLNGSAVSPGQFVPVTGNLVFTPAGTAFNSQANYATISFQVKDDGGTAFFGNDLDPMEHTLTLNLLGTSTAPSGQNNALTIAEDSSYPFKAGDFGFSDTGDSPADAFAAVKVTSLPTAGTLKLGGAPVGTGDFIPVGGIGSLIFAPAADANGVPYATFTFQAQDSGSVANQGSDLDPTPKTISFNVTPVNDPPTVDAISDPASILEGAGLQTVNLTGIGAGPFETQALSITAKSSNPALIPDPQVVYTSANTTGSITYAPAADQFGTAVITVTVKDDGGTAGGGSDTLSRTFHVTVAEVNDPPVVVDDALSSIAEDSAARTIVIATLLANDSPGPANESGQTLTLTDVGGAFGGTVRIVGTDVIFTPTADYNGPGSFTYTVRDDGTTSGAADYKASTGTVSFTITEVNDPPSGVDDGLPAVAEDSGPWTIAFATLLGNDSQGPANENGQALTITGVSGAIGGVVSIVGANLIFSPLADYNGPASFVYTLRDNGTTNGAPDFKTSTATVSFTITEVNDPPGTVGDSLSPVAEDSGQRAIAFGSLLANDSPGPANESGQTLTLIDVSGAVGGSVSTVGTFVFFTPATDYNGPASFTYTVRDDGTTNGAADFRTSKATVSFMVTEVNDPPSGVDDKLFGVAEDSGPLTVAFAVLLANDLRGPASESSQILTITDVGGAVGGSVKILAANVIFTPAVDYSGPASFTYTVRDNGTTNGAADFKTSAATASFIVDAVNDVPSFVKGADEAATDESPAQVYSGWATSMMAGPLTATDEGGQKLNFVVTSDNSGLFAAQPAIDSTGKLTFTPKANVAGVATVSVVLMDDGGTAHGGHDASNAQTFKISVTKPHVWHNTVNRLDVTADGHIAANDALEVINFINAFGSPKVPNDGRGTGPYCDVNGDGTIAPNDALDVINAINAGQGGEGEVAQRSEVGDQRSVAAGIEDLMALLAVDISTQTNGSRAKRA